MSAGRTWSKWNHPLIENVIVRYDLIPETKKNYSKLLYSCFREHIFSSTAKTCYITFKKNSVTATSKISGCHQKLTRALRGTNGNFKGSIKKYNETLKTQQEGMVAVNRLGKNLRIAPPLIRLMYFSWPKELRCTPSSAYNFWDRRKTPYSPPPPPPPQNSVRYRL